MFKMLSATAIVGAISLSLVANAATGSTSAPSQTAVAQSDKSARSERHRRRRPSRCNATEQARAGAVETSPTAMPPTGTQILTTAETATGGDTTTALTGTIGANVEMEVDRTQVVLNGRHGLRITVKNNSKDALEFDGDCATVHIGNAVIRAASMIEIIRSDTVPPTVQQIAIHALVDTVTVGYSDTLYDESVDRGPIFKRYGADEVRREDETMRFGKRIVWPGDSACGTVFFDTDRDLNGSTIDMPVAVFVGVKDANAANSMDLMNLNAGTNSVNGMSAPIAPTQAERDATTTQILTPPSSPDYMPPGTGTAPIPDPATPQPIETIPLLQQLPATPLPSAPAPGKTPRRQ